MEMLLQRVVDELRAVVRIKASQGKWQALLNADEGVLDADEGVLDALGLLVPDARALSPTGEDVSGRERPKILAPNGRTRVGHGIALHAARTINAVMVGANGHQRA